MYRLILVISCLYLFCFQFTMDAQEVYIPPADISVEDSLVHITYSLISEDPSLSFFIELVVRNSRGERIMVNALQGDVGKEVQVGNNKHIIWNPRADQVLVNADLSVSIQATPVTPKEPEAIARQEDIVEESVVKTPEKELKRSILVMQSAILPGWGLSRYTGRPHWIKGVVAYGCIAGAIIFNRTAVRTYDDYLESSTVDQASELLSQSHSQDKVSEVMAYTALAIWISDVVWTIVGTSDMKKSSIVARFDPVTSIPLVGFVYRF